MKSIKKYPYVKQRGLKDCGPACVAMILKYYGGYVNESKLGEMMYTNQNGTTAYHINETLKVLGFNSIGLKNNNLKSLKLPCIAHVIINHSYKHYIVIYKINYKKQTILIADPATNLKQITFKQFFQIWSGVTIQMYPIKKITYEKEPNALKFIWYYIRKNLKLILLVNTFSLFASLLSLASSLFLPVIITNYNDPNIILFSFNFFIIFMFKYLLELIKNNFLITLNLKIDKQLTTDIFWKILNLPYRYYRRKTTGEITSYFNDLYIIKNTINYFSQILLIDLPLLLILLFMIFCINYSLSIMVFLYFLIYFLIHKQTNKSLIDETARKKYVVNSYIVEAISGFETIKNLNVKSKIYDKFLKYYQNFSQSTKKTYRQSELLSFIKNIFESIVIFIVIIFLIQNNSSINKVIVAYIITSASINIIKKIFDFNHSLDELKYSLSNIVLLNDKPEKLENINSNGNIVIENLNFSYDKQTKILRNLNLTIENKNKVLVTGNSGSGKSTLFKLLKGYYKDYEGNITIGDKNLKEYYFQDIIYVSSQEFLFTGPLIDNLNLKNNNPNSINICEIENIFKDNPYQLIEENGFNLSSGQKQRIALARALCNFNILIIDEVLSQVSPDMERKILKKLFKTYHNKTIIFISHRLDNLDLFDQFVKINEGKVVLNTKRNN